MTSAREDYPIPGWPLEGAQQRIVEIRRCTAGQTLQTLEEDRLRSPGEAQHEGENEQEAPCAVPFCPQLEDPRHEIRVRAMRKLSTYTVPPQWESRQAVTRRTGNPAEWSARSTSSSFSRVASYCTSNESIAGFNRTAWRAVNSVLAADQLHQRLVNRSVQLVGHLYLSHCRNRIAKGASLPLCRVEICGPASWRILFGRLCIPLHSPEGLPQDADPEIHVAAAERQASD